MKSGQRRRAPAGLVEVGQAILRTRKALGWTQRFLASRARVSQATISRIERGLCPLVTVETLVRVCVALDMELVMTARSPLVIGRVDQADPVHARCVAAVRRHLERGGWAVATEVEITEPRSHGWIDLLAFDPAARRLLVIEVKTELRDLGALQRQLGWYARAAWTAARPYGWHPASSHAVLLVLETAANDAFLLANREAIDQAFPIRGRALVEVVDRTARRAAGGWGLGMLDPRTRGTRWLRALRMDGRRTAAPYQDYAGFVRGEGARAGTRPGWR